MLTWQLIGIVVIALAFEFINGFHDTANVVATSIGSRSLSPRQAIVLASIFNVIGAFVGTGVAKTITSGLIGAGFLNDYLIISALAGAVLWNLLTWYVGIPSSSSHALIGGIAGAAIAQGGFSAVNISNITQKVFVPMVLSPIIGFILAFIFVTIIINVVSHYRNPRRSNKFLSELQAYSTALLAFSHGSNDAQKTMAVITMALFSAGMVSDLHIPFYVIFACAIVMGIGTLSGGMKIIRTLSSRVAQLKPSSGVAAELSSGILIFGGSMLGLPMSTTHAASGSIMGAGSVGKFGVNWQVVRSMVTAWVLTFPLCALLSLAIYKALVFFF